MANVAAVVKEGYEGAEILGIHFEGPFLDMEYKGAQPPEAIASASVEQFKKYQEAAEGLIKYITLAPERDPDHALTRYCSTHGVVVSMGIRQPLTSRLFWHCQRRFIHDPCI